MNAPVVPQAGLVRHRRLVGSEKRRNPRDADPKDGDTPCSVPRREALRADHLRWVVEATAGISHALRKRIASSSP